jgi:hypothetical protein
MGLDCYKRVKYDRWTKGAVECYKRGCVCSNCPVIDIFPNCKMKYSVLSLVRQYGKPNIEDFETKENK